MSGWIQATMQQNTISAQLNAENTLHCTMGLKLFAIRLLETQTQIQLLQFLEMLFEVENLIRNRLL